FARCYISFARCFIAFMPRRSGLLIGTGYENRKAPWVRPVRLHAPLLTKEGWHPLGMTGWLSYSSGEDQGEPPTAKAAPLFRKEGSFCWNNHPGVRTRHPSWPRWEFLLRRLILCTVIRYLRIWKVNTERLSTYERRIRKIFILAQRPYQLSEIAFFVVDGSLQYRAPGRIRAGRRVRRRKAHHRRGLR